MHTSPLCTRHMPLLQSMSLPIILVALHCHLLQLATLAESTESTAIGLHHWWSNVLLYRLSLCALGRRKDNGETWGFKVET